MKVFTTTLLTMSALFLSSQAIAQQAAKEVQMAVTDAYVPGGFDANSEAYVIATGMYPNGCYQWSRAEVNHLPDKVHEVKTYAKVQQGLCLMVLVPFSKEIQLGKLEAGTHKVRFTSGDGTHLEKQVTIE